jgi:hypothetical protein
MARRGGGCALHVGVKWRAPKPPVPAPWCATQRSTKLSNGKPRDAMRCDALRALALYAVPREANPPNAHAKPSRPLPCRPHNGAPTAATNADAAGANCGRRDAREIRTGRGRAAAGPRNGPRRLERVVSPLLRSTADICDGLSPDDRLGAENSSLEATSRRSEWAAAELPPTRFRL